jgi:hypothetical protein
MKVILPNGIYWPYLEHKLDLAEVDYTRMIYRMGRQF